MSASSIYDVPDEVLITLMINMNEDELGSFVGTSKAVNALFKKHKEDIYREKLINEFSYSNETLYKLYHMVQKHHPNLITLFRIKTLKPREDCKDLRNYMMEIAAFMKLEGEKPYVSKSKRFRVYLLQHMYRYMIDCMKNKKYEINSINTVKKRIEHVNSNILAIRHADLDDVEYNAIKHEFEEHRLFLESYLDKLQKSQQKGGKKRTK